LKAVKILIIAAGIGIIGIAVFIHSGLFNIAADEPHWPVTREILSVVRDRSIQARSAAVRPPDLDNDTSIRLGAGNYDSMCTACHLAPGMEESELSVGLYPKPPTWREIGRIDPSEAFWVIKHGIKMTGMPAWGKSMSDKDIWNIVAFMRELPQLKPAAYRELVESSSGHLHENGEDGPHSHSGMEIPGLKISPRKFHLRQRGRYNSETGIRIEEIE
jgi:mono/diheme cytochrome c family protein